MKKNTHTAAPAETGSWVCPHCYRREGPDRYLISSGTFIPTHQDRRRYFHTRGTSVPEDEASSLLCDPRFLRQEELDMLDWPGTSCIYCTHCHMRVHHALKGAALCAVLTNHDPLADLFIRTMDQASSGQSAAVPGPDQPQWLAVPQPLTRNYVIRRDSGSQWLCVSEPDAIPGDPGYWRDLNRQRVLEAEQLLVLLRLDTQGDLDACLLLEDLVSLHGSNTETRAKQAAVILFPPEEEPELLPENHRRLIAILAYALGDCLLSVSGPEEDVSLRILDAARALSGGADLSAASPADPSGQAVSSQTDTVSPDSAPAASAGIQDQESTSQPLPEEADSPASADAAFCRDMPGEASPNPDPAINQ